MEAGEGARGFVCAFVGGHPDNYCRDHPLACIQRVSNSARFCSAATPSIPAEEVSFDASNWHSISSRPSSLSRPRSELSPPGRTQVVAQPATLVATAKAPIIIHRRPTTGPRRKCDHISHDHKPAELGQPLRHAQIAAHDIIVAPKIGRGALAGHVGRCRRTARLAPHRRPPHEAWGLRLALGVTVCSAPARWPRALWGSAVILAPASPPLGPESTSARGAGPGGAVGAMVASIVTAFLTVAIGFVTVLPPSWFQTWRRQAQRRPDPPAALRGSHAPATRARCIQDLQHPKLLDG
jgi:hypothetical protein